jgi:hypothetical protein
MVVPEPVPAELAHRGKWRIEPAESNETVTFGLRYPPSASTSSGRVELAKLGLTVEALSGELHPIGFEVRREAGTFVCQGNAGDGRGDGAFWFRPDLAYANAIAETGLPPLTFRNHVVAGVFNVPSAFVKAIVAIGMPSVTFHHMFGLRMVHITPEDVRAFHAAFPSEGLDGMVSLAMIGVTSAYVEALRRASVADLSADNVSALRASGVDRAFIERLAADGQLGLSIDQIVSLYMNRS